MIGVCLGLPPCLELAALVLPPCEDCEDRAGAPARRVHAPRAWKPAIALTEDDRGERLCGGWLHARSFTVNPGTPAKAPKAALAEGCDADGGGIRSVSLRIGLISSRRLR